MRVEFLDSGLAVIRTANAAFAGVPPGIIAACQRKLHLLDAVPDERTLQNWKSLAYQTSASQTDERSIKLAGSWRLVFTLDENTHPPTIRVRSIVDYH